MNQPDKMTPNPQPVSTVTKHIKIYSDNPIHDCIDRIIDSSVCLDELDNDKFFNAMKLHVAAKELVDLALSRLIVEGDKINRNKHE
jgi:hypothetical protein